MRFRAEVKLHGKTATGVTVPPEAVAGIELAETAREVEVPEDLALALNGIPGLRQAFDALAFTHRKEHVRAIEDARTAENRRRRIVTALSAVHEKRG